MLKRWHTKASEWAVRLRLRIEDERGIETLEWVGMAAVVLLFILAFGGFVQGDLLTQIQEGILRRIQDLFP